MTTKHALKIIKSPIFSPSSTEDLKDYFELVYIASGAFRRVSKIKGTSLVVKVPIQDNSWEDEEDTLEHSQREIDNLNKLRRKKYAKLHKYLPTIHYADRDTGIIIMERLRVDWSNKSQRKAMQLRRVFARVFGSDGDDYKADNCGYDKKGNLKILDLGII